MEKQKKMIKLILWYLKEKGCTYTINIGTHTYMNYPDAILGDVCKPKIKFYSDGNIPIKTNAFPSRRLYIPANGTFQVGENPETKLHIEAGPSCGWGITSPKHNLEVKGFHKK